MNDKPIVVKISCDATTPITSVAHHYSPLINEYLPNRGNTWKRCKFYFNDQSIDQADYWVIIGDIKLAEEQCLVPKENVIFTTGEPPSVKGYDVVPNFINQFYRVYTCHQDMNHARVFRAKSVNNWWVGVEHAIKSGGEIKDWRCVKIDYDGFKKITEYQKPKLISVFCSNKVHTAGHKARLNFCKKLKKHFKDRLDWYGDGIKNVESKWLGIAPYKYHIVLENCNYPDYWTEKLADCYMAGAYPIYSGAPNINDYFDQEALTKINILYPKTAIAKIEKIIEEGIYNKSLNAILNSKNLIMDKYSLFNAINDLAEKDNFHVSAKKEVVTIKNEDFFLQQTTKLPYVRVKKTLISKTFNSISKKIRIITNNLSDYFLLIKFKINK